MKFFSGFSLANEKELFSFWLDNSQFTIAGFSYGAIKAFEYALNSQERIDRLILLSPAYFCDKQDKYKKLQLKLYSKNRDKYNKQFLNNLSANRDMSKYLTNSNIEELRELLYYKWDKEAFKTLQSRGVTIEIILGGKDKIIDAKMALEFFKPLAITYFLKNANHILEDTE